MKKFFAGFSIIILSGALLHLWISEKLVFYILPKFNILVVLTSLFLFLISLFCLFSKRKDLSEISYSRISIIGFLLVLIFIFPAQPLSSFSVDQRGVSSDLSNLKLKKPVEFKINSLERTFADWIKIISTSEKSAKFVGEKAQIKGFTYKKDSQWYLSRFLIRCCAADASPVVLRVKFTKNENSLQTDQWLEITGTWQIDENTEQPLFIETEEYQEIPVPQNPYIY